MSTSSIDATQRLRLILSYLEAACAQLEQADDDYAEHRIDGPAYKRVRVTGLDHERRASRLLDHARQEDDRQVAGLGHRIRRIEAQQEKLTQRAASGASDPSKINAQSRQNAHEIEELRQKIAECVTRNEATHAADVGGFIAIPLEEYAARIGGPSIKFNPIVSRSAYPIALILLTTMAIALSYWAASSSNGGITFETRRGDYDISTEVEVVCFNDSNNEITLYAPWPEGMAPPQREQGAHDYGIELRIWERGANGLQVYPESSPCWSRNGVPLRDADPIRIAPTLSATITLDLDCIEDSGLSLEEIELVFSRAGGRRLGRYLIEF